MGNNVVETLIGTAVLIIAGFFLTYAYNTAEVGTVEGYTVYANFDRVDGLVTGSDVRMSGIKIGSVTDQSLDKETFLARVEMNIDSTIKLPEDTSAKISSEGLLGDPYISLDPGGSMDEIEAGGEITFTQGSIDLMSLIGQAIFSVGSGGGDE